MHVLTEIASLQEESEKPPCKKGYATAIRRRRKERARKNASDVVLGLRRQEMTFLETRQLLQILIINPS